MAAKRHADGGGYALSPRFHLIHFRSSHVSNRNIGRWRKGTSCASSRAPSGAIQNPTSGRKPTTPPTINSSAIGTRTRRDEGPLSQRRKAPALSGRL